VTIRGIHHITLICSDVERTARFYTEVLGLRLVKRTVNFDDPDARHYYFGDRLGSPGTVITFFEYPRMARGRLGLGVTHHLALTVDSAAEQLDWKARLEAQGVDVSGPHDRRYFQSIYFRDPDGVILEIATRGPGFLVDEEEDHLGEALQGGGQAPL
jgi:glyoxalase family protein